MKAVEDRLLKAKTKTEYDAIRKLANSGGDIDEYERQNPNLKLVDALDLDSDTAIAEVSPEEVL